MHSQDREGLGTISLLGQSGVPLQKKLEWFPAPADLSQVVLKSDELASTCPITGQPDWYSIKITYWPRERCIESKSLKLYLQSYMNEDGIFGEALACKIAQDLQEVLEATHLVVNLTQRPRGGISIESISTVKYSEPEPWITPGYSEDEEER